MLSNVLARACTSALVLILLWVHCVQCCGPGRGGTRRRSTRKLSPLIFKEHVPNVYENTLSASGLTEGAIARENARFHALVPNYNPDILFRDEEGTGADRLMTERCKERLDTLAISVMNLWPGVRLRVKEAWEEDRTRHSSQSLHYEGRAVDIATSDSDRSKYGMLARLAVEAGFDWVFYEARSHVHCSVKSESPSRHRLGGCFPGKSLVRTPKGQVPVSTITSGDLVQVMTSEGTVGFSPILLMIHQSADSLAEFLLIRTSNRTNVRLTPSHLVLIVREKDARGRDLSVQNPHQMAVQTVFAGQVLEGDYLLVEGDHGVLSLEPVKGIERVVEKGVFAPLTAEGNLIINDVVVSCYAIIDSQTIAHWSFLPVRLYFSIKDSLSLVLKSFTIVPSMERIISWSRSQPENLVSSSVNISNFSGDSNSFSEPSNYTLDDIGGTDNVHIHWYARLLYSLAKFLLPSHLTL